MRRKLYKEIMDFKKANPLNYSSNDFVDLLHCATGMLFASVALSCAPQSWNLTLLTVTSFQRYFLEALACFDYLRFFKRMIYDSETAPPVRNDLVGALTHQFEVAHNLYMQGVPVWLVRRPQAFPASIILKSAGFPGVPSHMVSELMEGVAPVFNGPAGVDRNRASQALRAGNIRLGHSAYSTYQPNPYYASHAQSNGKPFYQIESTLF